VKLPHPIAGAGSPLFNEAMIDDRGGLVIFIYLRLAAVCGKVRLPFRRSPAGTGNAVTFAPGKG